MNFGVNNFPVPMPDDSQSDCGFEAATRGEAQAGNETAETNRRTLAAGATLSAAVRSRSRFAMICTPNHGWNHAALFTLGSGRRVVAAVPLATCGALSLDWGRNASLVANYLSAWRNQVTQRTSGDSVSHCDSEAPVQVQILPRSFFKKGDQQ